MAPGYPRPLRLPEREGPEEDSMGSERTVREVVDSQSEKNWRANAGLP
ncbi:hypothetical protein IU459_29710 [Nocardia amamiensis]|uniref:Uncharacterized protein n=1 Tax=Nocardia amamiensis TaxID=404578 RepID=A0ABS0CYM0_9NOCA|nr:hypothetical protein [Nocardia amamiensis]MBF6301686.1 hypothetical protein [Nocardia amamiensis]